MQLWRFVCDLLQRWKQTYRRDLYGYPMTIHEYAFHEYAISYFLKIFLIFSHLFIFALSATEIGTMFLPDQFFLHGFWCSHNWNLTQLSVVSCDTFHACVHLRMNLNFHRSSVFSTSCNSMTYFPWMVCLQILCLHIGVVFFSPTPTLHQSLCQTLVLVNLWSKKKKPQEKLRKCRY